MQKSDAPNRALGAAANLVSEMKGAESMASLEESWKEFLHVLDRFWNKAEAHFSRSPKWAGWAGQHITARKKDDLLCYLTQARNVEEHSIEPITDVEHAHFTIDPADGDELVIDELTFRGNQVTYKAPAPVRVAFTPARTRLLAVTNRGRTYMPPQTHLGKPLDDTSVAEVADAALRYYEDFLQAAEAKFYDP